METVLKVCQLSQLEEQVRPASRAREYGAGALTDDELLTIILGSKSLCKYAHRDLNEMSMEQLIQNGLSTAQAIKVVALREYSKRMLTPTLTQVFINTSNAVEYFRPSMQSLPQETFRVLTLDSQNQLIEDKTLTVGTCDMSLVSIRELLTFALRENAAGIIVCHNHPNGKSLPSGEDHDVTERVKRGCDAVGIKLFDHIIIGGHGDYYSFSERGFLG